MKRKNNNIILMTQIIVEAEDLGMKKEVMNLQIKHDDLFIHETSKLPYKLSGVTIDDMILINKQHCQVKKYETLAEEIAHLQITYGDIRDQSNIQNRKFEIKARRLSYEILISLDDLIKAGNAGVSNCYEMSQYFEISQSHVHKVIQHYKNKYGPSICHNGFTINFEPLQIYKWGLKESEK